MGRMLLDGAYSVYLGPRKPELRKAAYATWLTKYTRMREAEHHTSDHLQCILLDFKLISLDGGSIC